MGRRKKRTEIVVAQPLVPDSTRIVAEWRETDLPVDARYYPDGPRGPCITLRGECRPEGGHRYEVTEREICGREITVIVQLTMTKWTNGIRVWYQSEPGATWYWQTSHFKNTLLYDPEFNRIVTAAMADSGVIHTNKD